MRELTVVVNDELGLHARPAVSLAGALVPYVSTCTVTYDGHDASATDPVDLIALGVPDGAELQVRVSGTDEDEAFAAVAEALKELGRVML